MKARASGWQVLLTRSDRGREIDNWVLHMPGYIAELIREKPDANSSVDLEETGTGRRATLTMEELNPA